MITYIDQVELKNQCILLRADFDISLTPDFTIADDTRLKHQLPTIKHLLASHNRLIIISKLGRPQGRDPKLSLTLVADRLKSYLPQYDIHVIDDFLTQSNAFKHQTPNQILLLENIRYYPQEKQNDPTFAKQLASLADIYVNNAFAMCHRCEASVVGIPQHLPSYGGLLLKTELDMIQKIRQPRRPFVSIIGGGKISDKIKAIDYFTHQADVVLIAGGVANTFLNARDIPVYSSILEDQNLINESSRGQTNYTSIAQDLLAQTHCQHYYFRDHIPLPKIIYPLDVVAANHPTNPTKVKIIDFTNGKPPKLPDSWMYLDIGPKTQHLYRDIILDAKTIFWNGPAGFVETPTFRKGTDFIFNAINHNRTAISIVGGGDTLATMSQESLLNSITHISTGGGAMLALIQNGTLPGLEVLENQP